MTSRLIASALAALFASGLAGCAATAPVRYDLVPVQSNGADLSDLDSRTILESRLPGGIVSIRADEQFAPFGAGFIVAVQNKTGSPIDFGPSNVEAAVNGQKLVVLSAEELDARMKADARSYIRANTRSGTVDLEAASATAEREYRFNNYGGCPAGQGNCQIASADNGSVYRQDRINRTLEAQTVAETALALQANQALIAQRALKRSTVAPEQMAGGVMVVEPPRHGGTLDLTVTFNGQKHRFAFAAKPAA
jgi:hypothetical protein